MPRAVLVGVAASNWVECRWVEARAVSLRLQGARSLTGLEGKPRAVLIAVPRTGRRMGLMMLYSCSQVGDEVEQLERDRPDSAEVYWQKSGVGGLPD